jgi:Cu(I)/Ag(I) efflux system membrane fusion protein
MVSFLKAEVLEVKQLFNKKIIRVKSVMQAKSKTFYATTALDESKIVDVTLRYSGFVEKIYANKQFMFLSKGDKLFTIYSKTLSEIKTELALAKTLGDRRLIQNLEKKLSLLQVDTPISSRYTADVRSPISGVVLQKHINEGSFVKEGTLLYKVADMRKMWVILKAYQKDLAFIKEGMDATIMIEGFEKIQGKVDFIYPFMDSKTKSVDVRILIQNPQQKIYPNLFAKVALASISKKRLILPTSAVLTKGEKKFVFKPVGAYEFEPVAVEAVRIDSHRYEIKSGLKEGDKVIDRALFMLDADAITNGLYESDDDEEW